MMDRFYRIFLCTLAMAVAGCAKVDVSPDAKGDGWEHDMHLPVPVEFALGYPEAKSIISDEDDLVGKPFGVFALNADPSVGMDERMYMDNVPATCAKPDQAVLFNLGKTYYYPLDATDWYGFYCYHPYTHDGRAFRTPDGMLAVAVPLGGTDDILYAKAETGTDADGNVTPGFNAEYLRNGGAIPSFSFSHPASGLSFRIRNDAASMAGRKVDYLRFDEFTMEALLCLEDADPSSGKEGQLLYENSAVAISYYLGGTDALDVAIPQKGSAAYLYETIFAMPQMYFECTLSVDGSEYGFILHPGDLQEGLNGHMPGHVYRYLFVIEDAGGRIRIRLEKDVMNN